MRAILILLYFTIGATNLIPYFDLIISIPLLFFIRRVERKFFIYCSFIVVTMLMSALLAESELTYVIQRFSRIISLVILLLYINSACDNPSEVVKKTNVFFKYLGLLIIADAVVFFVFGQSLWSPKLYLGLRFSGPFFDSNFLGLTYGAVFLYSWRNKDYKLKDSIIFLIVLLLSLSWSSIIFTGVALVFQKLMFNRIWKNQVLLFLLYCSLFFVIYDNLEVIGEYFSKVVSFILDIPQDLINVKFTSLTYRFDSQVISLTQFDTIEFLFGHGAHTIEKYMPRDTHNSYLGIAFELGFVNLFMIMCIFCFIPKGVSKFSKRAFLFFILMSCMLNTHYSVIYPFIYLMCLGDTYVKK